MADIGYYSLQNKGAFVAKLAFEYYNASKSKWIRTTFVGEITVGKTKKASPGDWGVPDGSQVRLFAFVVAGSDKTASEQFTYRKNTGSTANYSISGTTLINKLKYDGTEAVVIPASKGDISFISLLNKGAFVARIEFEYYNQSKFQWVNKGGAGDITVGNSKKASPGDHGVPDGSLVRLCVKVVAGTAKTASEVFTYKKDVGSTANYSISGTTLNSVLIYEGVRRLSLNRILRRK